MSRVLQEVAKSAYWVMQLAATLQMVLLLLLTLASGDRRVQFESSSMCR
jgi:hypothetical protein